MLPLHKTLLFSTLFFSIHAMSSEKQAEIRFNALCDFKTLNMNMIKYQEIDLALDVTLQPEAQARLAKVTRENISKKLVIDINGFKLHPVTVQNEMTSENIRVSIEKQKAKALFSALLDEHDC
ncbi:hypothetical protein [Pantoea sp.]|uniref:hypothetical protein n=1 Tax=Pantoea sp. TaxID=69393 RepID=UPI0031DA79E0